MDFDFSNLSSPMSMKSTSTENEETEMAENQPFSNIPHLYNQEYRSIEEISPKYRHIFQYSHFNKLQSKVMNDVLYTDRSVVVSAPTGSGKTVIFELAIVRLLMQLEKSKYTGDFKIIYMAPMKALCTERLMDWYGKFTKLGITCIEVTGDSDTLDFAQLSAYKIIMTTPEKWDSLTRRWKDNKLIMEVVKLFIMDEIHLLNEEVRGPVLEAVVSRMKTIHESINTQNYLKAKNENQFEESVKIIQNVEIRFVAASATIPNAEDIGEWLSTSNNPATCFKIGDEYRSVKLVKIVEGYAPRDNQSLFKFDIFLNYKLKPIIEKYCNGKPTLVFKYIYIIFCNTRKSVMMTADILSKELIFNFTNGQSGKFSQMASKLSEKKLQGLLMRGIGCHHAGLLQNDRNIIENVFRQGDLPLLITTSTLAMGVNLPAHLVIIKTTQHYVNGAYEEYEESSILQMMGRAGRPQFDTEGIAVIMTKLQDKERYERLLDGQRAIESKLHRHLAEHLNAEVALGTLPDLLQAMDWLRSTFLYVRATRNPAHYGCSKLAGRESIEKKLQEICVKWINALARVGLLTMDDDARMTPTDAGILMATHCLDFDTMKLILKIKGNEDLNELIKLISECHEFEDIVLRANEKRCLNLLNRNPRGLANRFPLPGKIQTKHMKANCLIQAVLGSLPIPDPSLNQESVRILRAGDNIVKCIVAYVTRPESIKYGQPIYKTLLNVIILAKCFSAKMWDNSHYVSRQFVGIGSAFASQLVAAGKISFNKIRESNPRDLERILNKGPPAGNLLKKQAALLPIYSLKMKIELNNTISLALSIENYTELKLDGSTAGNLHKISLIIGDSENNLLHYSSIKDIHLLQMPNATINRKIQPKVDETHTIFAHCISNAWVGLDVHSAITIKKSTKVGPSPLKYDIRNYITTPKTDVGIKEQHLIISDEKTIESKTIFEENDTIESSQLSIDNKQRIKKPIKKTPFKRNLKTNTPIKHTLDYYMKNKKNSNVKASTNHKTQRVNENTIHETNDNEVINFNHSMIKLSPSQFLESNILPESTCKDNVSIDDDWMSSYETWRKSLQSNKYKNTISYTGPQASQTGKTNTIASDTNTPILSSVWQQRKNTPKTVEKTSFDDQNQIMEDLDFPYSEFLNPFDSMEFENNENYKRQTTKKLMNPDEVTESLIFQNTSNFNHIYNYAIPENTTTTQSSAGFVKASQLFASSTVTNNDNVDYNSDSEFDNEILELIDKENEYENYSLDVNLKEYENNIMVDRNNLCSQQMKNELEEDNFNINVTNLSLQSINIDNVNDFDDCNTSSREIHSSFSEINNIESQINFPKYSNETGSINIPSIQNDLSANSIIEFEGENDEMIRYDSTSNSNSISIKCNTAYKMSNTILWNNFINKLNTSNMIFDDSQNKKILQRKNIQLLNKNIDSATHSFLMKGKISIFDKKIFRSKQLTNCHFELGLSEKIIFLKYSSKCFDLIKSNIIKPMIHRSLQIKSVMKKDCFKKMRVRCVSWSIPLILPTVDEKTISLDIENVTFNTNIEKKQISNTTTNGIIHIDDNEKANQDKNHASKTLTITLDSKAELIKPNAFSDKSNYVKNLIESSSLKQNPEIDLATVGIKNNKSTHDISFIQVTPPETIGESQIENINDKISNLLQKHASYFKEGNSAEESQKKSDAEKTPDYYKNSVEKSFVDSKKATFIKDVFFHTDDTILNYYRNNDQLYSKDINESAVFNEKPCDSQKDIDMSPECLSDSEAQLNSENQMNDSFLDPQWVLKNIFNKHKKIVADTPELNHNRSILKRKFQTSAKQNKNIFFPNTGYTLMNRFRQNSQVYKSNADSFNHSPTSNMPEFKIDDSMKTCFDLFKTNSSSPSSTSTNSCEYCDTSQLTVHSLKMFQKSNKRKMSPINKLKKYD